MTTTSAQPTALRDPSSPSTTEASTRVRGGRTPCLCLTSPRRSEPLMRTLWPNQRGRKQPPRPVYVGSHEDKLSRLPAMRIDPDYDRRNREDLERERAEGR